jgi:hypothetical protein
MNYRYVEVRRLHSRYVFSPDQLEGFKNLRIALRPLGEDWEEGKTLCSPWENRIRSDHHCLAHDEWRPSFAASASCEVRTVTDPADAYESQDTLCFRFDPAAVAAMDEVIANELAKNVAAEPITDPSGNELPPDITAELRDWHLHSLYIRWLADCQVFDVASVFSIPPGKSPVQQFDAFSAALTRPLHHLWPVFAAVIDCVWARSVGKPRTPPCPEAGSWENHRWPFGQPQNFYEAGHPDFDFSWEYDYDAILIVEGPTEEFETMLPLLRLEMEPAATLPDESRVFLSKRSVSVLHCPLGTAVSSAKGKPFGPDAHWAFGIVFISLILKYDGYNQRLYAAILSELAAGRLEDSAETLRALIYRTERLRGRLHERALSLSEYMNQVYKGWAEACDLSEVTSRVDRLTELVIAAAEGIETKLQQEFERRVQIIGLWFLGITLVTLVTAVWEFAAPEHAGTLSNGRAWAAAAAVVATVGIVIFLQRRSMRPAKISAAPRRPRRRKLRLLGERP